MFAKKSNRCKDGASVTKGMKEKIAGKGNRRVQVTLALCFNGILSAILPLYCFAHEPHPLPK